jgi:hypothetical protein
MRRKERAITDIHLIEEIITSSDVCRIGMADNNVPYIVTMNFGYSGGESRCLYFHCASEGKKLDIIKRNSFVCFEMDTDHKVYAGEQGCDWGMNYSSVVGYGNIFIVTDKEIRIKGLDCIMKQYGEDKKFTYDEKVLSRTTILKLEIKEMTGKKC